MAKRAKALITGANGKLAPHLARSLFSKHDTLLLHYRTTESRVNSSLPTELIDQGFTVITTTADFSKPEELGRLCEFIQEHRPESIINCASSYKTSTIDNLKHEQFLEEVSSLAYAPMELVRTLASTTTDSNQANFIGFSDARLSSPIENYYGYYLGKLLQEKVLLSSAVAFAPNIRVNIVCPGAVSDSSMSSSKGSDSEKMKLIQSAPLKALPNTSDIVRVVDFLLNSPSITGEIINVDGGRHLV